MAKASTSWKPGQTGNPHGRPLKEHSITATIKAMMDEKPEIKKALGAKIFEMALKGDITAIKTLWNYIDGMPQQDLKVQGSVIINMDELIGLSKPTAETADSDTNPI